MTESPQILTTGGIILDSVIAADGSVSLDRMGGNAVYSAVGAAVWCDSVALAGNVARNYPSCLLDSLASAGIGCAGVRRVPLDVIETEWFLNEPDGSRVDRVHAPAEAFTGFGMALPVGAADRARFAAFLGTRAPSGPTFGDLRARYPVTVEQALAGASDPEIVHLAPEKLTAQLALAREFKARGKLVSLDPGMAVSQSQASLSELLDLIDIFLPSEKELSLMFPDLSPADALRRLAGRTDAVLAVKLGTRGAMILDRGRDSIVEMPIVPVRALDPVGAGDAFCGGFAAGFLETGDPVEAAAHGTVSASFSVEGFGALHGLEATPEEAARRRRSIHTNPLAGDSR